MRALPQPLISKGRFVLAKNHGLLWLLQTPLQQDYRITARGIARRDGNAWQMLPNKSAGAEQNPMMGTRGVRVAVGARQLGVRYAYSLLPIALFYHFAHNSMHFFVEGGAIAPVASCPCRLAMS